MIRILMKMKDYRKCPEFHTEIKFPWRCCHGATFSRSQEWSLSCPESRSTGRALNSKSFVGKDFLRNKWKYELTVLELTMPNLHKHTFGKTYRRNNTLYMYKLMWFELGDLGNAWFYLVMQFWMRINHKSLQLYIKLDSLEILPYHKWL